MHNYLDVLKKIEETGAKAWLVGDTVRMMQMGIQPETITLAIDSDDMYAVSQAIGTGTVDARGPFPALRGELLGTSFRAFGLRGATIEDDLACRDLSIEAIAIRSDGGIVDPFNGRLDIRNKVIRLTGDNVELIEADPLRILRMLRFAAEFEMDIFWKTETDVRKFLELHADRMKDIPTERWGREILKGIRRRPCRFIELCDDYDLLPFFLKELEDSNRTPDGKGRTFYDHVLDILRVIEEGLDVNKIIQNDAFVLAGLFGHIGTKRLDLSDRDKYTDRIITEYLTRWNIPSETIENVIAIINNYQRFYSPVTEDVFCREVLNYSRDAVVVALQFARCAAISEGFFEEYREVLDNNRWNLKQVLRRFNTVELQTQGSSRYMTGREVMSLLQMKPGKRIGELLDGLDFAVGTGKVGSRSAAEAWLKSQVA
ncbi:MAG: CCA tRNA nucleotidyltransferase [Synergistaceae bacterium]|nr:CCA tRNA nucleotidyltransferase [Synergistaceae bacterium]MBQ3346702.1 CCA tRNA nucleotidyltransferase [Synergistaceae bacterium]MBQ3398282.1 CCA tRNA nucleotidyltransferase [Synergistaceae bacterium]MBQ3759871.1 CCA tRNA nucleotidyltransferase [Synergistaceae bacterium]MBQ6114907.1 CCA tRNA nucleotidyltransferase [Synergistaceae bacterium]